MQSRDPRTYIPPLVMVSSAMGLKLGVFGVFCWPHTQDKCVHNLRAPCDISTCVYLHAQTAVDESDVLTWWTTVIFDYGKKSEYSQFEPMPESKWRRFWDLWSISLVFINAEVSNLWASRVCKSLNNTNLCTLQIYCGCMYKTYTHRFCLNISYKSCLLRP